jgi:hypothetical protein
MGATVAAMNWRAAVESLIAGELLTLFAPSPSDINQTP